MHITCCVPRQLKFQVFSFMIKLPCDYSYLLCILDHPWRVIHPMDVEEVPRNLYHHGLQTAKLNIIGINH